MRPNVTVLIYPCQILFFQHSCHVYLDRRTTSFQGCLSYMSKYLGNYSTGRAKNTDSKQETTIGAKLTVTLNQSNSTMPLTVDDVIHTQRASLTRYHVTELATSENRLNENSPLFDYSPSNIDKIIIWYSTSVQLSQTVHDQ